MTREEAIELANDMAFMACIWIDDEGNEVNDLVKFAQLVAAKEREACANICLGFAEHASINELEGYDAYRDCEEAIRARAQAERGEA